MKLEDVMKISIPFLVLAVVVILFNGCKKADNNITGPPITQSGTPQWPMFRHDARHTGNVNTPIEGITGPSGDSVTVKWRIPIDGDLIGSPAIGDDGTIYIGTENPHNWDSSSVYAINQDGTIKWRYTPITRMWSSPAIGNDGSIYIGTLGGGFYAFTAGGQLKWIHNPGDNIISSPAIGKDGTIYYTNNDYLIALNPSDGSTKWQVNGGDSYCSPAISSDGTIYYGSYGRIKAVDSSGKVKWMYNDSSYTNLDPFAIEIGNDGTVYFVCDNSPYLYAIGQNGKIKWEHLKAPSYADPTIDNNGNIYVVTDNSVFYSVTSDGQLKFEITLLQEGIIRSPLVMDNNGIVYIGVAGNPTSLLAYNQNHFLWDFGKGYPYNDGGVTASPSIHNGLMYFSWDSGPYLYFYCLR